MVVKQLRKVCQSPIFHLDRPGPRGKDWDMYRPIILVFVLTGASLTQCGLFDQFQSWVQKERLPGPGKTNEDEIARLERDLRLSRSRSEDLYKNLHAIVQESNLQGNLSWKLARAYMVQGRYDRAGRFYTSAIKGEAPEDQADGITMIERALPAVRDALNRHVPDPDLLFDAGLCYANASRVMGWEEDRWRTAVLLFRRLEESNPNDLRAPYQLALLYAKTSKDNLRDVDMGLKYLDKIIRREENHIAARFAKAHILAENGELERSLAEYNSIKERLENLSNAGAISGKLEKNPQYVQAVKNIETLSNCLNKNDARKCEILGVQD